jgi:hypothetical protein
VGDLVLVTPEGDDPKHTYALLSNPAIEQLKVFDVSEGLFVAAPNVFFPLSIPVGNATRALAVAPGAPDRVYALDSAADQVMVVRTVNEKKGDAFTLVGDGIAVGRAPVDVAVAPIADGRTRMAVTLPEAGALQVFDLDPIAGTAQEIAALDLGGRPDQLGVAPQGQTLVVTNSTDSVVSVVDLNALEVVGQIDVGGPSGAVAMGRVDPGDGLAPVAVVLRRDALEVAVLRLERPGYREAPYALLGRTEMPSLPVAAYVPDVLEGVDDIEATVCCQGLTAEGEATTAWAAIMGADGSLRYLRMDGARDADIFPGRRGLVRLVDNNPDERQVAVDPNSAAESYQAPDGVEGVRPNVVLEAEDTFGDPPTVSLFHLSYDAVYEGALPGFSGISASYDAGQVLPPGGAFSAAVGLVQPGDPVTFAMDSSDSNCPDSLDTVVVDASEMGITVDPFDGLDATCLENDGDVPVTILAGRGFVVRDSDGHFLGRLALDERPDPDSEDLAADAQMILDGFVLRIAAGAFEEGAALAPPRGARILLSIEPNLDVVGLQLSRIADQFTNGFGASALFPSSAAGGPAFLISTREEVPSAFRRRLFIGTEAGILLEMDQGETDINDVIGYR